MHLEKLMTIKFNSWTIKNQNYIGEYSKDQKLRNALASCYMSLENSNEKGMALDIKSSISLISKLWKEQWELTPFKNQAIVNYMVFQ